MEYTGTIKAIGQTITVSDKFKKREFTVTDNASSYPQVIQFELHQDRCDLADPFKIGEEVTVKFNLKGREWKNPQGEVKTFNTLQAWAITKLGDAKFKNETLTPDPNDGLPF